MIKTLGSYAVTFSLVFALGYGLQIWILNSAGNTLRFDLLDVYWFFSLSSLAICLLFFFLSSVESLIAQLGFLYLPGLFIKGLLFYILFQDSVFSLDSLTFTERLCLLIPMLVFLFVEAYFIIKLLKKLNSKF